MQVMSCSMSRLMLVPWLFRTSSRLRIWTPWSSMGLETWEAGAAMARVTMLAMIAWIFMLKFGW